MMPADRLNDTQTLRGRTSGPLWLAACALCILIPGPAEAAKRNIRASVSQKFEHDSNLLLRYKNPESTTGWITTPRVELSAETPTSALSAALKVSNAIYNRKGYGSTDAHVDVNGRTGSETWSAGMSVRYDHDTTRTSELNSGDIYIVSGIQHELVALAPSFTKILTERDQLSLDGSALFSTYEKKGGYQDYNQYSINLTWSRMLDQKNTATVGFQGSRYETTSGRSSSVDNVGMSLGWRHQFSETLSAGIQLGGYRKMPKSELYFWEEPVVNTWEMSFDASLFYKTQDVMVDAWARRYPNATASGYESDTTDFGMNSSYYVSERIRLGLDARYRLYETPTAGGTYSTNVWSLSPHVSYKLSRDFSVIGSYRYSEKSTDLIKDTATSNAFLLELTYRPSELSIDW
ncbi:hypothetical protein IHV25_04740 [Phaeovibrio sulfidiphilus]|uniref:Uncharacterized protein n=1 Tax=Phaeovibrio sulfidiphilus TaxID=1220600 RepID=A0A8J6YYN8_9PROT|nr:hypothetical protein [Phaeovibrio sulfidiphilus]MBE1236953.1 hypothetical protein [Phaeovibrio sulfidiphilus]